MPYLFVINMEKGEVNIKTNVYFLPFPLGPADPLIIPLPVAYSYISIKSSTIGSL
jgi:hypothetical protein